MSKQYKRPLITFYMKEQPTIGDRGSDFRTLPEAFSRSQDALVDALVRHTRARQSMIRTALVEEDDAEKLDFVGKAKLSDGVNVVVERIQTIFQLERNEFRSQKGSAAAFNYLRAQVEQAGVFVLLAGNLGSHHTDLDTEIFRGFALADDVAPFVVVNNLDSRAAWSFTLLHELVHLVLGETGVSAARGESRIEKFCNDVASEFLFPANEAGEQFNVVAFREGTPQERQQAISEFSEAKNISSSMVAYKLFRIGVLDESAWRNISNSFRKFWLSNRAKEKAARKEKTNSSGPSYYTIKRHRLGTSLISVVDRMMRTGALSTVRAGQILDIGPKNVQNLFVPTEMGQKA